MTAEPKSKEKAFLRSSATHGAPPKSPSMLQKYNLLQNKFKQLNNSLAKIPRPLVGATAQTVYDAQAYGGKPRKKKAGSELRLQHQTSRSQQKKDLGSCPYNANVLDTSSFKSSQKQWNLPHNKFNYPHVPLSQKQHYGTLIRMPSKKKLRSGASS